MVASRSIPDERTKGPRVRQMTWNKKKVVRNPSSPPFARRNPSHFQERPNYEKSTSRSQGL